MFATAYITATSETNTSYEAGIKTAALDNRVHFNLAGFYYIVDHIQLNGNDSDGNGVLFNANKGKGYGVEAEFNARPCPIFGSISATAGRTRRARTAACSLRWGRRAVVRPRRCSIR